MSDLDQPREQARPGRRAVLQGTALTGVVAVLAACGQDSSSSTESAAAGGGSDAPSGESTGPSPSTTDATAQALVDVKDVPVGGGVIVDEVVITQPEQGTFKAFSAICTHAGCTVDAVADDVISCPCHGSTFSGTDGAVTNGPAAAPLPELAIEVQDGTVVRA